MTGWIKCTWWSVLVLICFALVFFGWAEAPVSDPVGGGYVESDRQEAVGLFDPPATPGAPRSPTLDEQRGNAKRTVLVHQPIAPALVDPQRSSSAHEVMVLALNYEGLTKLDEDQQVLPAAAERWEFNDTQDVITFTLRAGLRYSDGLELTAEHFRYAIERACDPVTADPYQAILFDIVGCAEFAATSISDTIAYETARAALYAAVKVPDDRTLIIHLSRPLPHFPAIAALWLLYPVRQELVMAGGEDWAGSADHHVGNGPFQVTLMEQNAISLDANPYYWAGQPVIARLALVYPNKPGQGMRMERAKQTDGMQPLLPVDDRAILREQLFRMAAQIQADRPDQ